MSAEEQVAQFERAVIEAQHKMANDANRAFVARLRAELIAALSRRRAPMTIIYPLGAAVWAALSIAQVGVAVGWWTVEPHSPWFLAAAFFLIAVSALRSALTTGKGEL